MSPPSAPPARSGHQTLPGWLFPALFLLATILAATTNHSFWIDECVTAEFVSRPKLIDTWRAVMDSRFAEMQMPFFITYMWAYANVFGHSELALRLAALPFYLGGMAMLVQVCWRRWGSHWQVALAAGLSPFAWFYLNEARLYAMQLGVTAMVAATLIRLSDLPRPADKNESRWLTAYLASVVFLSAISMLGEMWAGAALLAVFVVVPASHWQGWWRTHRLALVVTAILLLALGFYYLWTLTLGARATTVGSTNLQTFFFIFYEQLGFMGIGPGRIELRDAGVHALKPFVVGLAAYAIFAGLVVLAGFRVFWLKAGHRKALGLLACLTVPSSLILLAGIVTHFRVLGRHFAPLAIILFLILGAGLIQWWRQRGLIGKGIVAGFILVTLWSCLLIRFAPRHDKDDYRTAATLAKHALAENRSVWWNASDSAAEYYQVPLTTNGSPQSAAWFVARPGPGFATNLSQPDVVIASKPDVYDALGGLADFLKANHYQAATNFMAFTVWQRAGESSPTR